MHLGCTVHNAARATDIQTQPARVAARRSESPHVLVGSARAGGADESACKPGSVLTRTSGATIHLGLPLPAGSSGPPADSGGPPSNVCASGADAALLDLAPGGVYLAASIARDAGGLLHRRFTLTSARAGGLFSVALSRGSPRVAVNNHLALWSPDFPRRDARTSTRPPGRLVRRGPDASRGTRAG